MAKASDKVKPAGNNIKIDKTYTHKVLVNGTEQKVVTTCKIFGGLIHEGNFLPAGNCLKCKQAEDVKLACKWYSGYTNEPVKTDKVKSKSDSLAKILEYLKTPHTMKELQAFMGTKTTLYNICKRHDNLIGRTDDKKFFYTL